MAANGWDEALLRADDGHAPADRDMDVPFFIIYRGQTYKRQPQSVPPPGNLGEAQSMWKAHYESPAEVAWRKARKSAMRRPDPVEAVERRVMQRRADPEQEAVNLGALAHRHPPLLLTPRALSARFACARQRVAARCPSREGALLECLRAAFGCCIPALIAAHLHFAPSAVRRAVRIRGQKSGSVGKNTTDITEPDPMDGKDTHPALQQHDGVLTRRLRWAVRYFMSMRVAFWMSPPFPNVRDRMS